MSQYEVIIVDVSPTGQVAVKTEGFSGKACLEAATDVEKALGQVTNMTPTPEMHAMKQEVNERKIIQRKRKR